MPLSVGLCWVTNQPPKRNGLKQPSFYLLMILWVRSLDWGQALRGHSAGVF